MQLNEKQQLAVDKAADWYAKQNTQIFKMAGYAGTGKTTVSSSIRTNCVSFLTSSMPAISATRRRCSAANTRSKT